MVARNHCGLIWSLFRTRSVATFFFTLTMLVLVCLAEGVLGRAFRMLMRARAEVRAVATRREPSRWRSRVISWIGLALAIFVAASAIVGNGPTMASPEWAVRFTASPGRGRRRLPLHSVLPLESRLTLATELAAVCKCLCLVIVHPAYRITRRTLTESRVPIGCGAFRVRHLRFIPNVVRPPSRPTV